MPKKRKNLSPPNEEFIEAISYGEVQLLQIVNYAEELTLLMNLKEILMKGNLKI